MHKCSATEKLLWVHTKKATILIKCEKTCKELNSDHVGGQFNSGWEWCWSSIKKVDHLRLDLIIIKK